MIEIRILGTPDLRNDDGGKARSLLVQPKRFAVLAYLAAGLGAFHRRDTLLGLFWADLDESHARNALNKTVHHLRRALGNGAVVSHGEEELGLSVDHIECDVTDFERAVDNKRYAAALQVYRGDLLQGFFLSDAREFEWWIEKRQSALRSRAANAAWALAQQAECEGHGSDAAHWALRACAFAPDDERALRRVLTLLDSLGDRARALRTYDDFARRLAGEFDTEPAPETQALVRIIRGRIESFHGSNVAPGGRVPTPSVPGDAPALTGGEPRARVENDMQASSVRQSGGRRTSRSGWRRPRRVALGACAGLTLVLAIAAQVRPARTRQRDVLDVEEIARVIADASRLRLGDRSGRSLALRPTEDPEAYDLYLRGRYLWRQRTAETIAQAIAYFHQAIERDSAFALAYAGLADAYVALPAFSTTPAREARARARAAVLRALDLDSTLAEAHVTAASLLRDEWEWEGAAHHFARAVALAPGYATAHQWYGEHLIQTGRLADALAEFRKAERLDPVSGIIASQLGWALMSVGDHAGAKAKFERAIEIAPQLAHAYTGLGSTYREMGRYPEAEAAFRRALQVSLNRNVTLGFLGNLQATLGRADEAHRRLAELRSPGVAADSRAWAVAMIFAGLGEHDSALAWFDVAYQEHDPMLAYLKVEPTLRALRHDARMMELLQRIGLEGRRVVAQTTRRGSH